MNERKLPAEYDHGQLTTVEGLSRNVEAFCECLKDLGINVAQGSELEWVSLHALDLESKACGKSTLDEGDDIREMYRKMLGLNQVMILILTAAYKSKLGPLIAHLELMNRSIHVSQVEKMPRFDDASNKLFELLIALGCIGNTNEVQVDSVSAAKGNNPDVIAHLHGSRWGFACKVFNGAGSPQSIYEHLEKGMDQIEKSNAEKGCVVFNPRNVLKHDELWPLTNEPAFRKGKEPLKYGSVQDEQMIYRDIERFTNNKRLEFEDKITMPVIKELFDKYPKSIKGCMLYCQTVVGVSSSVGPMASLITRPVIMAFGDIDSCDTDVLENVHLKIVKPSTW